MLELFMVLFIILMSYVAVGTMPALKWKFPFSFILLVFSFITLLPIMIGVVLGAAFFYWLPILIFKIILFLFALMIVAYFYRLYHPSYGYIPYYGNVHWVMLSTFFFLLGLEFAAYGFSAWILLIIIPIGVIGLIGGFIFMGKILFSYRYVYALHLVPIVLFLFVALLKLL